MLSVDRERELSSLLVGKVGKTGTDCFEFSGESESDCGFADVAFYLRHENELIAFQVPVADELQIGCDLFSCSVAENVRGARFEAQQIVALERRDVVFQRIQTGDAAVALDLSSSAA